MYLDLKSWAILVTYRHAIIFFQAVNLAPETY